MDHMIVSLPPRYNLEMMHFIVLCHVNLALTHLLYVHNSALVNK